VDVRQGLRRAAVLSPEQTTSVTQ